MAGNAPEIRTILAPLAGGGILLPNNVVAEVVGWSEPIEFNHAPGWLLGEFEWQDWQVPVISFALLSGVAKADPAGTGSRILIIKTLSDSTSIVYLGIHIRGLPKLVTLTPDSLETTADQPQSSGVFSRVRLDGQEALIPELGELTELVEQAIHSR
jgi:chemosensory pili system protein ChpC